MTADTEQLTLTDYNKLPDAQRTLETLKSVRVAEADFAEGVKVGTPPLVDCAFAEKIPLLFKPH